jgi:S1-C subfamily serine protease
VVAVDPLTDLAIVRAVTKDGKNLTDRTPVEFISDSKAVDVGTFVIAM